MKSKAVLYLVVPLLAIVVFVIDQITKYWVSTGLAIGEAWMPVEVIARFVVVRHVRNSGAAFGIFPAAGPIFLGIAIVVVIGIVLYYYSRMNTAPLWVRISLGLMLGGAFGNMIDRVRFGYVVDFVDVGWFPVFNVADSSIVIGVTMLALYMSFFQPRSEQPAKPSLDQTPTS